MNTGCDLAPPTSSLNLTGKENKMKNNRSQVKVVRVLNSGVGGIKKVEKSRKIKNNYYKCSDKKTAQ